MSSSIAPLLKSKRKDLGLSVREVLAKLHEDGIDVSDKTLYGWESGHRQPDADTFLALCQIYKIGSFSNIQKAPSDLSEEAQKIAKSYEKLTDHAKGAVKAILGYEEKSLAHYSQQEDGDGKVITLPKSKRSGPMIQINVYNQPSAAGLGNYLDEPDFHIEQYPPSVIPDGTDFGIIISGDSMEPKIHNGGTVFVKSRLSIEPGNIGIFVLNGQAYCKRLMVDRENQQIRLVSLNPKYDDIIVGEFDELRTVGRVLGQWAPGYKQDLFGW